MLAILHFPQFNPVYPDAAVLSSVLTAAVTRAFIYRVTSGPYRAR